jgi:hypothetical protein
MIIWNEIRKISIMKVRSQIFTEILYRFSGPTKNTFLSDLTYFCRPIWQNRHFSGALDNSKQQQGSNTKNLFLAGSKNYKFSTIHCIWSRKVKNTCRSSGIQKSREKAVAKKTTRSHTHIILLMLLKVSSSLKISFHRTCHHLFEIINKSQRGGKALLKDFD